MKPEASWTEDELTPRTDVLTQPLGDADRYLWVGDPKRFWPGDVVLVGDQRLEPSGQFDVYGNEIMRTTNETVRVLHVTDCLKVQREEGSNPAQSVPEGETVTIIGVSSFRYGPA